MRLLILQLSDIHLRSENDRVLGRVDAIRRAVQSLPEFAACVLVVTGDVAFSGSAAEYALAHRFFNELRAMFSEKGPAPIVAEVFIPGNHDCCLPESSTEGRRLIVDELLRSNDRRRDTSTNSLLRESLLPQQAFVSFVSERPGQIAAVFETDDTPFRRLHYTVNVETGGYTLRFRCFNTAWLSQLHEQRGSLLAPVWAIEDQEEAPAHLTIALFHHPYSWLEAENAKAVRKLVGSTCDLVMTGHEHIADQFAIHSIRNVHNEYFEGAALQSDEDGVRTGFNVLLLDLEQRQCQFMLYAWRGDYYAKEEEADWRPLQVNSNGILRKFEPTVRFAEGLADTGMAFTHPRKQDLRLTDIFVYPDLEDQTPIEKNPGQIIRGENIQTYILTHRKVLLIGDERCGRTSLAKMLWRDFAWRGHIPLLMTGSDLKKPSEEALRKAIGRQVERQYGSEMDERFWQRDPGERVLLLDDLHQSGLNREGRRKALDLLARWFGTKVLFADDPFRLTEIPNGVEDAAASLMLSFRHCAIKPFGYRLRAELIRRWCRLGQEDTASEEEITSQVRDLENLVTALFGKNLLPSYPQFVLFFLQSREASLAHDTEMSAYGHYYQALITMALDRAIKQTDVRDSVDTIFALASDIAYRCFSQATRALSKSEMRQATAEYKSRVQMGFDDAQMLDLMHRARILTKQADGGHAFGYDYVYYFFVARYIHHNLSFSQHEPELRDLIQRLTTNLAVEENANIVIFLVHFRKDEQTIRTILEHAKSLNTQCHPSDLDRDVEFVGRPNSNQLPRLRLDSTDLRRNNQEYRARLDEAERQGIASPNGGYELHLQEEEEPGETVQIDAALKTLQVMGQILRNFPGSLPGDLKTEIATECYLLGLRTLRVLHTLMETHLDAFRLFFSEAVRQVRGIEDDEERARVTDRMLGAFVLGSAHWMIKTISQAVGSEQLEQTFEAIDDRDIPLPKKLIDVSIKLDHFRGFPWKEIDDLKGATTDNVRGIAPFGQSNRQQLIPKKRFAFLLLQWLVRDHLYLYPVPPNVRQSVCAKLDIVVNEPQMLSLADKHLVKAR